MVSSGSSCDHVDVHVVTRCLSFIAAVLIVVVVVEVIVTVVLFVMGSSSR